MTIAAPNSFARDWLENHYIHLITGILTELTGEDLLIKFVVQKPGFGRFRFASADYPSKNNEHHDISRVC